MRAALLCKLPYTLFGGGPGLHKPRITNALSYFDISFGKRSLSENERGPESHVSTRKAILAALGDRESLSVKKLIAMSRLSRGAIAAQLRTLVQEGLIEPTEVARSPRQRYRLTGKLDA